MRRALTLLSMLALGGALGCDQLTATVQAAAALTASPSLDEAQGMPTSLRGVLPPVFQGGATGIFLGLGERESITSSNPPVPIPGATATLTFGPMRVALCAGDEPGTYAATSVAGALCASGFLSYQAGEKYVLEVETRTALSTLTVRPPPPVAVSQVTFVPAFTAPSDAHGAAVPRHTGGGGLRVDWRAAGGADPAFVTLFRVTYVGPDDDPSGALEPSNWAQDPANPLYDNFPKRPSELINLVLASDHATSVDLPPESVAGRGLYIVVVTPVKISTDVSNNLSLGSGILAGRGTAFVFWVD